MTPIAEMVRRMLEKGVAHDAIVMAVEGAELAMSETVSTRHPPDIQVDETIEKRRAWDREYRRRKRLSGGHPPDIHPNPPDIHNASLSKEEKIESKIEEREAPKRSVHPTRGQRLADDWAAGADDWQAAQLALGNEAARTELAKFRDHWKQQPGSRGVKLDWNAAWRNWIRRAAEYRGGTNGNGNHNASRRSASADFFAGIASVAADIAGNDQSPRDAPEEIPLGRFNING